MILPLARRCVPRNFHFFSPLFYSPPLPSPPIHLQKHMYGEMLKVRAEMAELGYRRDVIPASGGGGSGGAAMTPTPSSDPRTAAAGAHAAPDAYKGPSATQAPDAEMVA